jgi:hypothetical protein
MSNMVPNVDMMVPNSMGGKTSLVVGSTTITGGTDGNLLYDNAGVLGEQTIALKETNQDINIVVTTTGSDSNSGLACFDGIVTNGGTGFSSLATFGTVSSPISLTGGSGTGATAIIVYGNNAGAINRVIGISPGTGYHVGDVLSANSADIGGGTGFAYKLTAIRPFAPVATIQHAATIALGYDYAGIYNAAIVVGNGTYTESTLVPGLFGAPIFPPGLTALAALNIYGDNTTPSNVVITTVPGGSQLGFNNGSFAVSGFKLTPNVAGSSSPIVSIGEAIVQIVDIGGTSSNLSYVDTGSHFTDNLFNVSTFSRLIIGNTGNDQITFSAGFGSLSGPAVRVQRGSISQIGTTFVFNGAIVLPGSPFFSINLDSTCDLSGASFTNPANVTGGTPISMQTESAMKLGVDPATITWPSGPFDPKQIDASSNIDGFFYAAQGSGLPVAGTNLYKGAWRVYNDTRDTTLNPFISTELSSGALTFPGRIALNADTNFYVSTVGSDSNDGLTSGTAWATLQHATSTLSNNYDAGGHFITINLTAGTFVGAEVLPLPDCPQIIILGASVSTTTIGDAAAVMSDGNTACVGVGAPGTVVSIKNLTAKSTAADAVVRHTKNFTTLEFDGDVVVYYNSTGVGDDAINGTIGFCKLQLVGNTLKISCPVAVGAFAIMSYIHGTALDTSAGGIIFDTGNCSAFTVFFGNDNQDFDFLNSSVPPTGTVANAVPYFLRGGTLVSWPTTPVPVFVSPNVPGTYHSGTILNDFLLVTTPQDNSGVAGPPTTVSMGDDRQYGVFKDTANGPRTLAVNDGGVIYTRQIGNNINFQTGTAYTLTLADQEGIVEMNNANPNTLTVPANVTIAFPIGTKISVLQEGAGLTTIAAAVGVTIRNVGALVGQYKTALLYKRATNEWIQTNGAF